MMSKKKIFVILSLVFIILPSVLAAFFNPITPPPQQGLPGPIGPIGPAGPKGDPGMYTIGVGLYIDFLNMSNETILNVNLSFLDSLFNDSSLINNLSVDLYTNYYNKTAANATFYPLFTNPAGYLTNASFSNGTFVLRAGDTMTGNLNMSNNNITDVDILFVHNISGRSPITIMSPVTSNYSITADTFFGNINGQNGTIFGVTITNGSITNLYVVDSAYFDTNVTFNGSLIPDVNNTYDLGTAAKRWRNFWVQNLHVANISVDNSSWVLRTGDTMSGNLNMSNNNITDVRELVVSRLSILGLLNYSLTEPPNDYFADQTYIYRTGSNATFTFNFNETKLNQTINTYIVDANSSIWNELNNKLNITDQRYNDTVLINAVNTTTNIQSLGFNTTAQLDSRYYPLTTNPAGYLTNFTETDPVFTAENISIWNAINSKLNITDERYNDTTLILAVNTSVWNELSNKLNITDQRYNDTTLILDVNTSLYNELLNKLNITDQRYNDTTLILAVNTSLYNELSNKLNITDQRYNDTILILDVNTSLYNELSNKLNITDQRYNDTTLILDVNTSLYNELSNKLNITDQRYNDTALINAVNTTANIQSLGFYNSSYDYLNDSLSWYSILNPQGFINLSNITGFINWSMFGDVQYEPTGFDNPTGTDTGTGSSILYNIGTHNFTINGTYIIWQNGLNWTKTYDSIIVPTSASGYYYIYYNNGVLTSSSSITTTQFITNYTAVALLYYNNNTAGVVWIGDERHGHIMDGVTHLYLHLYFSTRYNFGLSPQNLTVDGTGNVAADAQYGVTNGAIVDEDVLHITPDYFYPAEIQVFYQLGTTGNWSVKNPDTYPMVYSGDSTGYVGANGRLPYNRLNAGTWSLTQIGNNDYVLLHLFATNDIRSNRTLYVIQGQTTYATVGDARTGAATEINSIITTGLPMAESKAIATFIVQSATAMGNVPKAEFRSDGNGASFIDWRNTLQSGTSGSSGSISLILTGNGLIGGPITTAGTISVNDTYIQLFNDTIAIALKLNITDQRYNDTAYVSMYYYNKTQIDSQAGVFTGGTGLYSVVAPQYKGPGQMQFVNGSNVVTGIGTDFIGGGINNLDTYYSFFLGNPIIGYTRYFVFPINNDTSANLTSTLFGPQMNWTGGNQTVDYFLIINDANGTMARGMGFKTNASGYSATAMGYNTLASGDYSTTFGQDTIANASTTTAFGSGTVASGLLSTAFGFNTQATGNTATVWGQNGIASGTWSTAFGYTTTASGQAATAFGESTIAFGRNSIAMGDHTNVTSYADLAIGRYNVGGGTFNSWVSTDPVFEIGNGNTTNKSNALTVYKNGTITASTPPWASPGTCSGVQVVQNTTTSGVQCTSVTAVPVLDGKLIYRINMTLIQTSTTSNTVYSNITNLTLFLSNATMYLVKCEIIQDGAAATTGVVLRVNTTGTPSLVRTTYTKMASTSAMETFTGTNVASNNFVATGSSTTASIAQLNGLVQTAASASTWTVELRSEVSGSAANVESGSYCMAVAVS